MKNDNNLSFKTDIENGLLYILKSIFAFHVVKLKNQ